ncbi:hypothetical protein ACTXK4_08785 [Pseudomonas helleri]
MRNQKALSSTLKTSLQKAGSDSKTTPVAETIQKDAETITAEQPPFPNPRNDKAR